MLSWEYGMQGTRQNTEKEADIKIHVQFRWLGEGKFFRNLTGCRREWEALRKGGAKSRPRERGQPRI